MEGIVEADLTVVEIEGNVISDYIICRRDSCFDPTSKIMGTIEYVSEQSELECHDMGMRFERREACNRVARAKK